MNDTQLSQAIARLESEIDSKQADLDLLHAERAKRRAQTIMRDIERGNYFEVAKAMCCPDLGEQREMGVEQ